MTLEGESRRIFKDRAEALEVLADELSDLIWSDHAQGYTHLADDWACQVIPECDPVTADEDLFGRWSNVAFDLIRDSLIIVVARTLYRSTTESYEEEVNHERQETQNDSYQS